MNDVANPTVFAVDFANPEIFLALQRGSSKRRAWHQTPRQGELGWWGRAVLELAASTCPALPRGWSSRA